MLRRCRELGGPASAPPAGRERTAHRWDPHRRAGHVRPAHAGRAGARGQRGSVAGGREGARRAPESTSSGTPSKTVSAPRRGRFWTCRTGWGRMCRGDPVTGDTRARGPQARLPDCLAATADAARLRAARGGGRAGRDRTGVCPGSRESAGKRGSGRTRKGNRDLRRVLCEIAHAASRTRNAQFGPLRKDLTVRRVGPTWIRRSTTAPWSRSAAPRAGCAP